MTTQFKFPNEKKRKPLSVRIPAWINSVDDIAKAHDIDGDRLRVLLHQFFLCYLKNSKLRRAKAGSNFLPEYFPVSSVLLRQTCTDNYIRYVNALIDEGVIEKRGHEGGNSSYVVGGHAQLYRWRIPDSFYGGCSFKKESVTGHKQIKSVLRTRDQHIKECEQEALKLSKNNPIYVELLNCLNDVVFDESYHEMAIEATSNLRFLETEALANRDFNWFTVDAFGHRLHHPLTTMPKEYRKYLRFKDRPDDRLVILDLKNSQPYMSSIIVNKALIIEYLPAFVPMLEHIYGYEKKADFLLYRRLCVEGRLYEFLMEGLGYNPKLDQTSHKIRTQIKELFFSAVLFSRTRVYGEKSRFRESFRLSFPGVHEMFQVIKRLDETVLPRLRDIIRPQGKKFKFAQSNDAYKLVSCLMQRIESVLMYKVVAPRLLSEGIRCVTVHDSFIIHPNHVDRAMEIIKESIEGLGLPAPKLSVD